MKKQINIMFLTLCMFFSGVVSLNTAFADEIKPAYCVDCGGESVDTYALSGAKANMIFPNMPQTSADVGWYLGVETRYYSGKFLKPVFFIYSQDVTIFTNMWVDEYRLVLDNCTYNVSGNKMYIEATYHVEAMINGAKYSTYQYKESFVLVA